MLAGEVPRAQDWLRREDWPHPDDVIHVFGSWEKFLQHAQVPESRLLARLRTAEEAARAAGAREERAERELARVEDLRRQAETARRRREAAEAERQEAAARAERLAAQLERAEARAAAAEEHLAERRQQAAASPPPRADASDEWLAAHAALEDELEAVRAHREELLRAVEEERDEAAQAGRTIARLSAALAEGRSPEADAARAPDEAAPGTVLEAVDRAAAEARALRFTPDARASAQDSPFRRPADILDALRRLDRLAELYADPAGFGTSLTSAAQDLGPQVAPGRQRDRPQPQPARLLGDGRRPARRPRPARRDRLGVRRRLHRPDLPPRRRRLRRGAPRPLRRPRRPPPARHDDGLTSPGRGRARAVRRAASRPRSSRTGSR